jgi:succinate dehydrogenase / fumarate reductase membrane anchor subunit
MRRKNTRSPLARATGLGSARSGVDHWWAERISALALVPLALWFVASVIGHLASDHDTFVNWVQAPAVTVLLVLLLAFLFHHAALGLEVIVEDYVHSGLKFAAIVLVRLGCFAVAVAGIVATLRIAFSA